MVGIFCGDEGERGLAALQVMRHLKLGRKCMTIMICGCLLAAFLQLVARLVLVLVLVMAMEYCDDHDYGHMVRLLWLWLWS